MTPSIYVAGPSAELEACRQFIREFLPNNCFCNYGLTHDWTKAFDLPVNERPSPRQLAIDDINGVANADILIMLLFPGVESSGQWAEFGFALAQETTIYAVFMGGWPQSDEDQAWLDQKIFLRLRDRVQFFWTLDDFVSAMEE